MRLLLSFSGGIEEHNLSPYKDLVIRHHIFDDVEASDKRSFIFFSWARLAERINATTRLR